MKKDTILFVSLDTHKKFHHAAYVEDGRGKTPVDYGQIPGSKIAITKLLRKLHPNSPMLKSTSSTRPVPVASGFIDTSLALAIVAMSCHHLKFPSTWRPR